MSSLRTMVRRSCYVALPLAACLIVPGFWLMPNRQYAHDIVDATVTFQVGYGLAIIGVVVAVLAFLILILAAEE